MRQLLTVAVVFAGAAALVVAAAWAGQRHLVYLPYGAPPAPGDAVEPVTLRTEDGLELGAWWFPPAAWTPTPAVLVFPGNAGNRGQRAPLGAALAAEGFGVLLVDYRGYGGNPGRPSQDGLLADARAAYDHVVARPDVDPDRIAYFGESLGAGPAAGLAVERPPAAMVLRSPFTSLADIGALHYPWLPVRLLLRDHYPVEEWVQDYPGRVLVVAGGNDRIIPAEHSRRVAQAAGAQFVVIPGADHNDPALLAGDRLIAEVSGFLDPSVR